MADQGELNNRLQQMQAARQQRQQQTRLAYDAIEDRCTRALADAPQNWIALECLGNERDYAKPDTEKRFVVWEAKNEGGVQVEEAENLADDHPWLRELFLPAGLQIVRFPFNSGDSGAMASISWQSVQQALRPAQPHFYTMPRWSTASRSSVGLVPQDLASLPVLQAWPAAEARTELQDHNPDIALQLPEWNSLGDPGNRPGEDGRFYNVVPRLGTATSIGGMTRDNNQRFRLYSIKTGVNYVGSKFEGGAVGKHRLEANCTMAMLRSKLIRRLRNVDASFGLQLELLTITAPMRDGTRDGFQVRDLSCLRDDMAYLPGQALPYGRRHFDHLAEHREQCEFWRENFAVPLGRAKARLFLNYGLIHTSANAQNFVLGFRRGRLAQFVVRDLGDTSWHDDYITKYMRRFEHGLRVNHAFGEEAQADIKHVLHSTSSGQYPPPHIVRIAAYSLLTHRFGENLGWSHRLQYRFASGIFEGFLAYVCEALGVALSYPDGVENNAFALQDAMEIGRVGGYPPGLGADEQVYRQCIRQLRQLQPAALLQRAQWIRQHGEAQINSQDRLHYLIGAEEALLCCAVERHLQDDIEWQGDEHNRILNRLRELFAAANQRTSWPAVVR